MPFHPTFVFLKKTKYVYKVIVCIKLIQITFNNKCITEVSKKHKTHTNLFGIWSKYVIKGKSCQFEFNNLTFVSEVMAVTHKFCLFVNEFLDQLLF